MREEQPIDQSTPLNAVPSDAVPSDAGRRAWLRKGAMAASPVLFSLASAPVHAAGVCVLPSGFISVATFNSRHPGAMICVDNRGPNFWNANFPGIWPISAPNTQTSLFSSVFFGTPEASTSGLTIKAVLGSGSFTTFTKYCIAGYLNARVGTLGFPLSDIQMVNVWGHFRGGSTPLIPASWTEADAVTWLISLMGT